MENYIVAIAMKIWMSALVLIVEKIFLRMMDIVMKKQKFFIAVNTVVKKQQVKNINGFFDKIKNK